MRTQNSSPGWQAGILSGVLLAVALPLAALSFLLHTWPGLVTVAVALLTCLAAALLALALASLFPAPEQVVQRVLLGMVPRMGIPLAACVLAYLRPGMLVEAGFVYYIMAFYFVALLVETVLQTRSKPNEPPTASRTG